MSVSSGSRFIHAEWALLPDGWRQGIRFEVDSAGSILSVGSALDKVSDAQLEVVVPGMINVHSHAFQRRLV